MAILKAENISFEADGRKIIDDISFELAENDYVALIGSSGSGKSTFLKILADLTAPDEGELYYKSKKYASYEPTKLRRELMLCFQEPYLFRDTVADNLEFPYKLRKLKPDQAKIKELMAELALPESFYTKEVADLSGGEKQRIALVRSLIFEPSVLLLDEVTSALDPENKKSVESAVAKQHRKGAAIIRITHDHEEAKKNASRIVEMSRGKIIKEERLS